MEFCKFYGGRVDVDTGFCEECGQYNDGRDTKGV